MSTSLSIHINQDDMLWHDTSPCVRCKPLKYTELFIISMITISSSRWFMSTTLFTLGFIYDHNISVWHSQHPLGYRVREARVKNVSSTCQWCYCTGMIFCLSWQAKQTLPQATEVFGSLYMSTSQYRSSVPSSVGESVFVSQSCLELKYYEIDLSIYSPLA